MSAYRAGQRVRIEWTDGSAIEALAEKCDARGSTFGLRLPDRQQLYYINPTGGTRVTVLAEPRPDEPTGLGAVVEASVARPTRQEPWVRCGYTGAAWLRADSVEFAAWDELINPVVLSDGWVP